MRENHRPKRSAHGHNKLTKRMCVLVVDSAGRIVSSEHFSDTSLC